MSRRRLARLSYISQSVVSTILSLLLVPGSNGGAGVAQAHAVASSAPASSASLYRFITSVSHGREFTSASEGTNLQPASSAASAGATPPAPVTLTASTVPSQGQAGSGVVYVSGTGFPSGTIAPSNVTVHFATSCGGSAVASATPSAVQTVFGTTRRVQVLLPATIAAKTYFLSLGGTTSSGTAFASTNCSTVQVTSAPNPAVLSISKTHMGSFTQGQPGTYTVMVSNTAGAGPTSGLVTVTETVPAGMTLGSMAGTGWSCLANTCTRSDALTGGASYPAITVPVTVYSNAISPQVNAVGVSGGGSASASASDSTNITANPAVLSISKTHVGSFTQGQSGASYTLTIKNAAGAGPTSGAVTVTETVPSGLSLVSLAGTGWSCAANSCSRSDALAGGANYPPITATVNVAASATSPQVNAAGVSGGGSAAASATDSTNIGANPAVLSISKTHAGSFTQGQLGASYTLTVANAAGAGPTSGAVTVTETVPSGLSLVSLAGTGWSCATNSCSRSDALAGGASYPPITAMVNVAASATSPQINAAGVTGGGSAAASATDSTNITANPAVLSISKTHTGSFTQGQLGASYTLTVANAASAGPTSGAVTVTETVPSGLSLVSLAGTGWSCATNSCSRSDALAGGASYPPITATVNVATSATSPQINAAGVTGGGSAAASASDSTVITGGTLPAPTISINSPVPGSQITQPSDVFATITDNTQGGPTITWTVDLRRINTTGGGIRLGSGTGSVADGKVGSIDPTLLANDTYALIVTANQGGQATTAQFSYDVTSANLKLGEFEVTFADISTQIAGLTITLLREYNSLDVSQGDFGDGWRLKLPGRVSISTPPGSPFTTTTRAYVTRPDGRSEGFTFNEVPQPFPFFGNNPVFIPDPGVTDTLIPPSTTIFCGSTGCHDFLGNPYDPTNFVLQTKDQFQYTIDEFAGLQQIKDPNGNTISVTPTGLVSSTGVSIPFTRDSQGRITSITGPATGANPPKVTYAYDASGNLVSFFDQLGNKTQYFYESASFPNYLTRVVDPLGRALIRNVFDSSGHLIATCNANGNVTTLAGCTTYSQDTATLTQTTISPRGFRTDFILDNQGNVLIERHYLDSANFLETDRTYDANNNKLTEKDPAGNITSYTYDSKGNILTMTKPGNRTTTYTYSSCNRVATSTDPAGQVTTFTYDSNCNLLSEVDPLGNTTTYQYNALGEVTNLTDAVGNQWSSTYDASGLLTSNTDPFGAVTTYQNDPAGFLLSKTDRNGRRIDYQYDAAHHRVQETWNTTPPRVTNYSYDGAGELTGTASPDYSTTLTHDQLGRLITEDNQGTPGATHIILNYSYDADGNVTSVQDSLGGSTQYTYDPLSRLSQMVQTGTGVSAKTLNLLYDASNLLTEVRRFADATGTSPVARTLFQYDCGGCADRITGIQHLRSSDGAILDNLTYVLDAAGNVTSSSDAEGSHQYTYDADRQLLTATHTQTAVQPNEFYTYDKIGNRLTSHRSATYTLSYMNGGKGNRLLNDAQFTYVYDAEGNLTRRTSRADSSHTDFTWDHLNRITSMVQTSGTGTQMASETYVYDFVGRRIRVVRPQSAEQYFYFGLNPVLVLDSSGNVLSRNLYGLRVDELYAREQTGQTKWTLFDRVQSVRDTISNTAIVLNHFVYDSFGDLKAHSSAVGSTEDLFTGREFSTAPLVGYFRARYYSPDIGRFLSEDPLEPYIYSYGGNNPSSFTDPLGLATGEYEEVHIPSLRTLILRRIQDPRAVYWLEQLHYLRLVGVSPSNVLYVYIQLKLYEALDLFPW